MLKALRKRMTYANVAMTLALVFAMTGGAYAAKKYLITSTKQISPSVLKSLVGKAGAAGTQGPAGPQGSAGTVGKDGLPGIEGKTGKEGPAGQAGADGKSVLHGTVAPSNAVGSEGDFYINTTSDQLYGPKGASSWPGSPVTLKGSPWVVGAAPDNVVLNGTWSIQPHTAAGVGESLSVPVSTGVPIPAPEGTHLAIELQKGVTLPGETTEGREGKESTCPGSATEPLPSVGALAGFVEVCVYVQNAVNLSTGGATFVSSGGMIAAFQSAAPGEVSAHGSWALRTP